jgi:hypothetical protein
MQTKGLLFGSIGLERAGHVFLTVGIIDLLMNIHWIMNDHPLDSG